MSTALPAKRNAPPGDCEIPDLCGWTLPRALQYMRAAHPAWNLSTLHTGPPRGMAHGARAGELRVLRSRLLPGEPPLMELVVAAEMLPGEAPAAD